MVVPVLLRHRARPGRLRQVPARLREAHLADRVAEVGLRRRHVRAQRGVLRQPGSRRHRRSTTTAGGSGSPTAKPSTTSSRSGSPKGPLIAVPTITLEGDANGAPAPGPERLRRRSSPAATRTGRSRAASGTTSRRRPRRRSPTPCSKSVTAARSRARSEKSRPPRREYDRRVCRILAYLGEPLPVQSLLFDTDNSLVRQSYSPRMMNTFLNLAGFGMKAWDPASLPARGPVHLSRDDPAVVRPQPALPLVQARADLSGRPRSRGHLLRRGGRRRHEPAPVPLRRRPRRARAQRAPAPVPAHALRARRARAPRARAADRGDDRLRVDLRAGPVAARRSLRRSRRPASSRTRPPTPCASCARSARHTASTPPRRSTSASAPAAPWSPPASRSTTAGTRRRTRCSRPTSRS